MLVISAVVIFASFVASVSLRLVQPVSPRSRLESNPAEPSFVHRSRLIRSSENRTDVEASSFSRAMACRRRKLAPTEQSQRVIFTEERPKAGLYSKERRESNQYKKQNYMFPTFLFTPLAPSSQPVPLLRHRLLLLVPEPKYAPLRSWHLCFDYFEFVPFE